MALVALSIFSLLLAPTPVFAGNPPVIPITVLATPSSSHVVDRNFLGISFELSFLDSYFGSDVSSIPKPILNYLGAVRDRTGSDPVRIRVGGNSLDTSTYVPTQTTMLQRLAAHNSNDQPARYGPVVWDVLSQVSSSIKGVAYVIGLSLINATNPLVPIAAADAYTKLGSSVDAFLLGNEPDVYSSHGFRPKSNWTETSYIKDYNTSSSQLSNTTAGNILTKGILAGPAVCCNWDLSTIINDGYIADFGKSLKYLDLQHYANNNCEPNKKFNVTSSYYTQHSNVVQLGTWQQAGINSGIAKDVKVIMSEFNSISCGGVAGISDTFAVGSMWTVDYALQLASVGFSAAHIHTREAGIPYNLFTSSDNPAKASSTFTTNPPFYGVLVTAEALQSKNGAIVVDLNIGGNSQTNAYAGYAVYDASDKTVQQLVLFNYANVSVSDNQKITFSVPQSTFSSSTRSKLVVKYLGGESMSEKTNIAWGGMTFANVGDGNLANSTAAWAPATVNVDCSKGCNIDVPGPGLAVVFAGGESNSVSSTTPSSSSSSSSTGGGRISCTRCNFLVVLAFSILWTCLM